MLQPTGIVESDLLETAEDSESATDDDSDNKIYKISDALKNVNELVKEPPIAQ